ncbi:MAG: hypothetical protein R3E64_03105 [Halioglobus sp.]
MSHLKSLSVLVMTLHCVFAFAQAVPNPEDSEPSLEQLDAAYTAEDFAREAAAWSDVIIDRTQPDALTAMTAAADLVFRGSVVSQQTVYDANDLPFTHTTFSISEVLKGSYPSAEITVIQEGGPSRTDKDSIVIVSDADHFAVGDEELLFLAVNPQNPVSFRRVSVNNRFCILDNKVYDENGHGLLLSPAEDRAGYRLTWSRDRNPAPRFSEIQIGSHTLTKQFQAENVSPDIGGDQSRQARAVAPGYQSSVSVDALTAAITSAAKPE